MLAPMIVQIFGHRKCAETRKAERFFKERRVSVHFVDLERKAMSRGELRAVAARVPPEELLDRDGARFRDRGLGAARLTGAAIEELLLEDPLLLRTPVVRIGARATVGFQPGSWAEWLRGD